MFYGCQHDMQFVLCDMLGVLFHAEVWVCLQAAGMGRAFHGRRVTVSILPLSES